MNTGEEQDVPGDAAQARVMDLVMRWADDYRLSPAQLAALGERIKASDGVDTWEFWERATRPLVQALEVLPVPSGPTFGGAQLSIPNIGRGSARLLRESGGYLPYLRLGADPGRQSPRSPD